LLEASLEPHVETVENPPTSKPTKKTRAKPKAKVKPKPDGYAGLAALVDLWHPSDPCLTRNLLVQELRANLENERYSCIYSCVPALIVDGAYPIELMHFRSRDDIDEFVTRLVWMQEVFKSAIGIFMGVPDDETSKLIMDVCSALLKIDDSCVILLRKKV